MTRTVRLYSVDPRTLFDLAVEVRAPYAQFHADNTDDPELLTRLEKAVALDERSFYVGGGAAALFRVVRTADRYEVAK